MAFQDSQDIRELEKTSMLNVNSINSFIYTLKKINELIK